jgi:hypothetical protein
VLHTLSFADFFNDSFAQIIESIVTLYLEDKEVKVSPFLTIYFVISLTPSTSLSSSKIVSILIYSLSVENISLIEVSSGHNSPA